MQNAVKNKVLKYLPQPIVEVLDIDHFEDWPTPYHKDNCPERYVLADNSVSIIIYMKDALDSLPVQTFLSTVQFTRNSKITISNVVLVFINNTESLPTHLAHVEYMMDLAAASLSGPISVLTATAETEWKAKLAGVKLANAEQVVNIASRNANYSC